MWEFDKNGYLSPEDAKEFRVIIQRYSEDQISGDDLNALEQVLRGEDVILSNDAAEKIVDVLHGKLRTVWNMLQTVFAASSLNMLGTGKEVDHKPNLLEAIEHFVKDPDGAARFRKERHV